MKFIHTSDWHIGRQLHNVSLLDDQQHILSQIIQHIKDEAVEAVVIAGDIYDRAIPPTLAVTLLDNVLHQICIEMQIPVIMIPGNHDSAQRLSFGSRQLKQSGLHIIDDFKKMLEPVVISTQQGEVHFYGLPYNDPESVRNHFCTDVTSYNDAHEYLIDRVQEVKQANCSNVLISHCFIDGALESDSERPLSIGGADRIDYQIFSGFDYVALGHLHAPQFKGEQHIRYSGSILKYSFSEEKQQKGITLVEMDKTGFVQSTQLGLKPIRDLRVIEGEIDNIIEQGKTDPGNDDYLLIKLTDRHAILDPMGKLRKVYPNVLHLEKPGMLDVGEQQMSREKLKHSELDMFRDFFVQISGESLNEKQDEAIVSVLTELHLQKEKA